MLRVDCQSHVFPEAYAELLKRNTAALRVDGGNGSYTINYGGLQKFHLNLEDYSPTRKLRDMDGAGIDVSVLSVNIPGPERLDTELGIQGARLCNDYLAELCDRYPNRFVGLASLPLQDVPAAITELDRAIDQLNLRGVMLFSHINGKPVDAQEFEPFYRHVEARGIPLVLHPTVPSWSEVIQDYSMIPMLGFMVDTSIAMLRLILSGILERYPHLKIVHPHVGGVLPYVMGRVEEQTEVKKRGREHITKSPAAYYEQIYLDMVSPSPLALRYVYDFAGAERLLFGTDHPWVAMETFVELVNQMNVSEVDKARMMGLNASELFRIN